MSVEKTEQVSKRKDNLWRKACRKFLRDKIGVVSLIIVGIYAIIALGAAFEVWAVGWDELYEDAGRVAPSVEYPFGTNINGQDVFQRVIYSTKTAFEVGMVVALLSTLLGAVAGCIAGFFNGRWIDEAVLWLMGSIDCIPFYLFVAAVGFALQEFEFAMHVAMISTFWTSSGRLIRGEVIKLKHFEFVEAAHAIGVPSRLIMLKHIMPNTSHILLVQSTITFVGAIKSEVILSFLGLGVKDSISWGLMIAEASQEVSAGHFNNFLAASGFLFVLVMAFNMFSDSIQDALDPRKVA